MGEGAYRDYRLVRWSAYGTPTVEISRRLKTGGIADDGAVLHVSLDGLIVWIKGGQTQTLVGTSADSTIQLDRTGALFVTKPDGKTVAAYRLR